jgi:hypothetical protein
MKKNISSYLLSLLLVANTGCSFFEVENAVDPNNPSLESISKDASRAQIDQLAVGLQSTVRSGLYDFYFISGTVGREVIVSASTESRYFTELLGVGRELYGGANDPNGLFNGYYTGYSSTRRRAEVLIQAAENTTLLSEQEKNGIRGFANTFKAYVVLNMVNMQGKNGVRESFSDLLSPGDMLKPGPFTNYEGGLALAKQYAEDAKSQLQSAGGEFAFTLTSGYTGFDTPEAFLKFNRAIAARIYMHQKDWTSLAGALNESFLDISGDLAAGPAFTFSTAAGDQLNLLYQNQNTSNTPVVVFNEHIQDAEENDARVFGDHAKVSLRDEPRISAGVPNASTHEVSIYEDNGASVPIIKNEELILMLAELMIQTGNLPKAVEALDVIRTANNLETLAQAKPAIIANQAGLITELLHQRRYSLFYEGHRWIDMKRYNRIAELPLQDTRFGVFEQMARPESEVQWDNTNTQ